MNIDDIREFCLNLKGTEETFPFDEVTLVFKVMNKMYCLTNLERPLSINLKCDPEKALELREEYEYVRPGFHMNKKYWNTIDLDGIVKDSLVKEWIEDSYNLVVAGLTKKAREELKGSQE